MTEPESSESLSEQTKSAVSAAEAENESEAPEPQPEPWTPARVVEWNAYYDLYVALGVLLLTFVVSTNKITHSSLWTWLQAGRTMASQGKPLVTDPFSYTETGQRWVNIPWLFEWSHALIFDGVEGAAPTDPTDPVASKAKGEQYAAATLVALSALARLATVLLLLKIRHPGPGLWWSSVCAALALGACFGPAGLGLGGIAGTANVAPGTWGTLLLALELYLWYRAVDRGRRGALLMLIPLFLAWANIDESFLFGLLVLAAGVVGQGMKRGRDQDGDRGQEPGATGTLSWGRGSAILGTCAAVSLVNPSFHRAFPAALGTLLPPYRLSPFTPGIGRQSPASLAWPIVIVYLTIVALGLGSFLLNRRRFAPGRFLMYIVSALCWGAYLPYRAEFAVVFAATLALNGQEWYHDRFGTSGRLGRGWTIWSVGGRAVTIVLVFGGVALALTGWGKSIGDPVFGFGYNVDAFAFEMAEFLKSAKIQGRVLNTTREQGDALVWRAYPEKRLSFIDSREHLFPPDLTDRLQKMRVALSKDDVAGWKPLLDEYGVSVVILDEPSSPRTYQRLLQSPNWIPFYDDGMVVLFGRADAPAADLAFFREHQLSAEALAYKQSRTVPPPDRPPTPMSWLDRVFRNRWLLEPQPHTSASMHWLQGQGNLDRSETGQLPDPAHCFLAIQEARIALSRRPDDTGAYRILSEVYRVLMLQESAILDGLKLTPENAGAITRVEPRTSLLMDRFRQRATALNHAIQTTPLPRTEGERQALFTLNFQLFQQYTSVNFFDLARERLQAMLDHAPEKLDAESRSGLNRQLIELNGRIQKIQDDLNDLTIERQYGPLQRAVEARNQGAPGLALLELEEAERTGVSPAVVRPQLVDLYCDTGQPEKALELLNTGNYDDPSLGAEPGVAAARQARVYFLLGYYDNAARLLEDRAIPQLRYDRSGRALLAAQAFLRGQVKPSTSSLLDLPGKIAQQASWELELALCRLESGRPDLAAEPLTRSLTLAPDLALRPLAAYYLERLGKPVPPPAVEADKDKVKDKEPDAPKPADQPQGQSL